MNKFKSNISKVEVETQISQFQNTRDMGKSIIYRIKNDFDKEINHFVGNIFQVGYKTTRLSLLSILTELTWGSTFYYELRTVKQLGYIVQSGGLIMNNIQVNSL